jgi:hypothetical protein
MKNKINELVTDKNLIGLIDLYQEIKYTNLDKFGSIEDEIVYLFLDLIQKENKLIINDANKLYFELKNKTSFLRLSEYRLFNEINWGKYKGLTIEKIIKIDIQYIKWCIINLDNFIITDFFFLNKGVYYDIDFIKLVEINLLKRKFLCEFKKEYSYDDDRTLEDITFEDGFEGDVDTWNHFNQ